MIDAVIFDLYETLVTEFDPNWQPQPSLAERLGVDQEAFDSAWRAAQPQRMIGAYPDFPSVLRDICRTIGEPADEAILRQLSAERLALKAKPLLEADARVVAMLRGLRNAGRKIGLVSNCAWEEVAAWDRGPLAPLIEAPVFSCDAGLAKPDPAIYRLACERLGVAPEAAAFIGDGGSDELAGAAEAGLTPYWASWFVDKWPEWRQARDVYVRAREWPRLKSPGEVVATLAAEK